MISKVYFTVDPNPGFEINSEMSISVKSGSTSISYSKVSGTDNLYSFVMPSGNVTVNVTNPFKLCQYTISYDANGGRRYGYVWNSLPTEYNVRGEDCRGIYVPGKISIDKNGDTPTFREGYIFAGRCKTADCSDEPITSTTTITVSGVEETGLLYGDVNSDGKLDIIDLVRLKKHIAGAPGLTLTEEQLVLADANTDGDINAGDLIELRTILLSSK